MRKTLLLTTGAALLAATIYPQTVNADSMNPTMLTNPCASCHGPDGKSPGEIPSINGKTANFIEQVLAQFKAGKREATVMDRIAKGYSDEQIKIIARQLGKSQ